jgi:predicted HNH restriction endonuclease
MQKVNYYLWVPARSHQKEIKDGIINLMKEQDYVLREGDFIFRILKNKIYSIARVTGVIDQIAVRVSFLEYLRNPIRYKAEGIESYHLEKIEYSTALEFIKENQKEFDDWINLHEKKSNTLNIDKDKVGSNNFYPTYPEGAIKEITQEIRYRNPKIKSGRIEYVGHCSCEICDFDFEEKYGDLGKGFIECHHLIPLSDRKGNESTETSIDDVVLVCSNCHRVIHKNGAKPITIDEIKNIINKPLTSKENKK